MTASDDLLGAPHLDDLPAGHRGDRRTQVLTTLADILITAGVNGRRFAVVDAGADCAAAFADDLAVMVRDAGTPCARLRDASDAEGTDDGIILADGAHWRARPPRPNWDVTIYLRTPPPAGQRRGPSRDRTSDETGPGPKSGSEPKPGPELGRGHGDGEFGADIVVDHHDAQWPVIRHVAADLEHAADRLYLDETRAFFASRAFRWNDRFGDDRPAYEQAIRESDVPRGATVVDVGCGTGRALPAMRDAVGDGGIVIGIDLTPEMLTVASLQSTSQFQLLLADARRLPLADGSVDVVFAAGLVQHLPDPAAGLAELARLTRRGGRLIVFHPSGRAALAARHGRTLRDDEPLAPNQLRQLLDRAGWSLVRYDDPPHRFYALAVRSRIVTQSAAAQRSAHTRGRGLSRWPSVPAPTRADQPKPIRRYGRMRLMKSEVISVRTGSRPAVRDVTSEANSFLAGAAGGGDGLLHVFVPHATAGIAIIETGAGSDDDLVAALDTVLPADDRWRHRHGSPGHGRDHVVPAFVAPYATLPVLRGRLALGTWQSICLVDPNGDNAVRQIRFSFLAG